MTCALKDGMIKFLKLAQLRSNNIIYNQLLTKWKKNFKKKAFLKKEFRDTGQYRITDIDEEKDWNDVAHNQSDFFNVIRRGSIFS